MWSRADNVWGLKPITEAMDRRLRTLMVGERSCRVEVVA